MSKNINKIPTGNRKAAVDVNKNQAEKLASKMEEKVKTLEDRKKRKEEREKQYENFRINALRRRCKRMKFSEELTNKAVEELKKQLKEPASYKILLTFKKGNKNFVIQALKNAKIEAKSIMDSHSWIYGDSKILDKIREILPTSVKICPYKEPAKNILSGLKPEVKTEKKPTNNTPAVRKAAKSRRKKRNIELFAARPKTGGNRRKNRSKRNPGFKKRNISLSRLKKMRAGKVVQATKNNATETKKTLKNAA